MKCGRVFDPRILFGQSVVPDISEDVCQATLLHGLPEIPHGDELAEVAYLRPHRMAWPVQLEEEPAGVIATTQMKKYPRELPRVRVHRPVSRSLIHPIRT